MNKKNIILVIILAAIILAIVLISIFSQSKKEQKNVLRDFSVEDTASITKIFLADMNNNTVTLKREDGYWSLNNKYIARKDFLNILLETIKNLEIAAPVAETKYANIMKDISTFGTKVEIYQNNELTKTFFVGKDDSQSMNTYMILEGSEKPFAVNIPGFSGFLSIRFLPILEEWREKIVFNYPKNNIKKINITYPKNPEATFTLEINNIEDFKILDVNNKKVNFDIDTLRIKEMLHRVKYVGFEAFLDSKIQKQKLDSLSKEPILNRFEITDKNNEKTTLTTYKRKNIGKLMDNAGTVFEWDVDNLYGVIKKDDKEEVVLIQYYIFDAICFALTDFDKK